VYIISEANPPQYDGEEPDDETTAPAPAAQSVTVASEMELANPPTLLEPIEGEFDTQDVNVIEEGLPEIPTMLWTRPPVCTPLTGLEQEQHCTRMLALPVALQEEIMPPASKPLPPTSHVCVISCTVMVPAVPVEQ